MKSKTKPQIDGAGGALIEEAREPLEEARSPIDKPIERLISLKQMTKITGWHRTTVLRAEGLGHIPRRRKLPNGQTAFLGSEVQAWIESLELAPLPNAHKRELAAGMFSQRAPAT